MTRRIPDPASPFEDAGLPDLEAGLPGKRITGDTQDDMPVPGDEPMAVDDFGTTAAEQREGEPLDLRLSREEPDVIGEVLADEPGDALADEAGDELDGEPDDDERAAGRIVETDEGAGPDLEPDAVGFDVGTETGGMSAEEQALHVEPG
jgi:hypothetical protein